MTRPRVGSIPAAHPYVAAVVDTAVVDLVPVPGETPGSSPLLDAAWHDAHPGAIDILHLHFGFESRRPYEMEELVRALRRTGTALLVTVHDLRNPHLGDNDHHEALLDVVVPTADAVTTLTRAAARVIRRRWGRDALVIAHPNVVPPSYRPAGGHRIRVGDDATRRVGVHLKSLRRNVAAGVALDALARTCRADPSVVADVLVHPDAAAHVAVMATAPLATGRCTVTITPRLSDPALFDWMAGLDVLLLSYRFGTHSGLLEAAKDLGTKVVAPREPTYIEQGCAATFVGRSASPEAAEVAAAIDHALAAPRPTPLTPEERRERGTRARRAHSALYVALGDTSSV